jgi:hypothetical protein
VVEQSRINYLKDLMVAEMDLLYCGYNINAITPLHYNFGGWEWLVLGGYMKDVVEQYFF